MTSLDDIKFTIGKHKGETFGYVYDNDKSYCDWVCSLNKIDSINLLMFSNYVDLREYAYDTMRH